MHPSPAHPGSASDKQKEIFKENQELWTFSKFRLNFCKFYNYYCMHACHCAVVRKLREGFWVGDYTWNGIFAFFFSTLAVKSKFSPNVKVPSLLLDENGSFWSCKWSTFTWESTIKTMFYKNIKKWPNFIF